MGLGKTYSTRYLADSNNNTGAAGQVLSATATGIDWVDGSGTGIIGGPYLPLSAGSTVPLTGDLYISNATYIRSTDSNGAVPRTFGLNSSNNMYIGPIDSYAGGAMLYGVSANVTAQVFYTGATERMRITSVGNVGIGTTSPTAKLQVNNQGEGEFAGGNSASAGDSHLMLKDEGGTTRTLMSGPSIVFQTPANSDGTNIWATSRLLGSPAAAGSARGTFSIQVRDQYDPLSDGTSWNWRTALTAINTGNVGIGTTSPNNILHVSDAGTSTLVRVGNNAAYDAGIYFNTSTDWTIGTDTSNSNAFTIGNSSSVGASPKVTIATGGNVGIGTSNPETSRLLVRGSTNDGASLIFQAANLAGASRYVVRPDGDNKWYKSDNSLSMILTSTGNVGINTTSPGAKFQVKTATNQNIAFNLISGGSLNGTQRITAYNDAVSASVPLGISALEMYFLSGAANTEAMRIDSAGNVGIGYSTPIDFISVGADNLVIGPLSGNNGITVNSATTGYGALAFADGTGSSDQYRGLVQYNHTADSLALFTNASTKMTILSGGNVGIGTTSPSADLHVNSVNAQGTVIIGRTGSNIAASTGLGVISFPSDYNSSPTNYAQIRAYSNALSSLRGSLDFNVKSTSGSLLTGLTVYGTNSGANVGIGTDSPDANLDILNGTTGASLKLSATSTAYWQLQRDSVTGNLNISDDALGNVMSFDQLTGNVGIGNGNPQNKLDIEQSAAVSARLLATGATSSSLKLEVKGGATQLTTTEILANSSGTLTFATGTTSSAERMRITSAGNVGIGTTSPGTFLQLGTYAATGKYINQATYPDIPGEHMMHITAPSTNGYYGGGISFGEATFSAANIVVRDAGGSGALDLCFGTGTTSGVTEKMCITNAGGISFGSTGTAYGTSGQVLTSAGNASPTWTTPSSGGVTSVVADTTDGKEGIEVTNGGTATVTVGLDLDLIDQGYVHYIAGVSSVDGKNYKNEKSQFFAYDEQFLGGFTGDGTTTTFTNTHNLGFHYIVQIKDNKSTSSTYREEVYPKIVRTSATVITVTFNTAPDNGHTYTIYMTKINQRNI